jgi:hypothetical protein
MIGWLPLYLMQWHDHSDFCVLWNCGVFMRRIW